MNIYDTQILENQIEEIAKNNDGEIPEDLFEMLVESETKTDQQVENLINYLVELDFYQDNLKVEKQRIDRKMQVAKNKSENIKKYMLDFVESKGKFQSGSFTVSTRKSKKVVLNDDFFNLDFGTEKTIFSPDKKAIKTAIDNGAEIYGAEIKETKKISIK